MQLRGRLFMSFNSIVGTRLLSGASEGRNECIHITITFLARAKGIGQSDMRRESIGENPLFGHG